MEGREDFVEDGTAEEEMDTEEEVMIMGTEMEMDIEEVTADPEEEEAV